MAKPPSPFLAPAAAGEAELEGGPKQPSPFASTAQSPMPSFAPQIQPEEADNIWSALEAGWEESTTGLLVRMEAPDTVLTEHADMAERIAYMVSRTAGDFPTMAIGYAGGFAAAAPAGAAPGAAVGSVVPGAGTVAGGITTGAIAGHVAGSALAMGLTEGTRRWLLDAFEQGDKDALTRLAVAFGAFTKGTALGGVTAGAGRFAAAGLSKTAMPEAAKWAGISATELTTMVTTANALEGTMPRAQDFMDGAILLTGLKLSGAAGRRAAQSERVQRVAANLKERWVKTGEHPVDAAADALVNVNKRAGLLSDEHAGAAAKLIGQRVAAARQETAWQKAYRTVADDLDPIKVVERSLGFTDDLPAARSPYKQARLARGVHGKAAWRIAKLTKDIGFKLPEQWASLKSYVVAARAVELEKRGIKSGFSPEDMVRVKAEASQAPRAVKKAAEKLYKFQDDLVDEAVAAGLLGKKAAAEMKDLNRHYVPFRRIFERKPGDGDVKGVGKRFKAIKGSEKQIADPFEMLTENSISLMKQIQQNQVNSALVALGAGVKVKPLKTTTKLSATEIRKVAKELEVDPNLAKQKLETMKLWRLKSQQRRDDEILVWKDGKPETYRVGKTLAEAMYSLDPQVGGQWLRLFSVAPRTLRALTVVAPDFIIRNFFRDQLTAGVYSRDGFRPIVDWTRGLMSIVKKDKFYDQWKEAGGENTALISAEIMVNRHFEVGKQASPWNMVHPVKAPAMMYRGLRAAAEAAENATRVGQFRKSIKAGATPEEAAFRSREVTLDFARKGGAAARIYNQLTAFWNVQVQGIDRFARVIKEDPKGAMTKVALTVTAPSVALWLLNHDEEWYQQRPRWEKDLYWLFSFDGGDTVYKFPKPHEIGVLFGSVPEHILDAMYTGNPKEFQSIADALTSVFLPLDAPTTLTPFMETWFNKSMHTGGPVIRRDIEDELPETQYVEYTSASAKLLAKAVGASGLNKLWAKAESPVVLEHFANSWLGSMGRGLIDAADKLLEWEESPDWTLADYPVVKAFVARNPHASGAVMTDFRDAVYHTRKIRASLDKMKEEGNVEGYLELVDKYGDRLVKMDGWADRISKMSGMARAVWRNKAYTPEEKRQLIDQLYTNMQLLARHGNNIFKQIREIEEGRRKGVIIDR